MTYFGTKIELLEVTATVYEYGAYVPVEKDFGWYNLRHNMVVTPPSVYGKIDTCEDWKDYYGEIEDGEGFKTTIPLMGLDFRVISEQSSVYCYRPSLTEIELANHSYAGVFMPHIDKILEVINQDIDHLLRRSDVYLHNKFIFSNIIALQYDWGLSGYLEPEPYCDMTWLGKVSLQDIAKQFPQGRKVVGE